MPKAGIRHFPGAPDSIKDIRNKVFIEELHVPETMELGNYDRHAIQFLCECKGKDLATARLLIDHEVSSKKNYGLS